LDVVRLGRSVISDRSVLFMIIGSIWAKIERFPLIEGVVLRQWCSVDDLEIGDRHLVGESENGSS